MNQLARLTIISLVLCNLFLLFSVDSMKDRISGLENTCDRYSYIIYNYYKELRNERHS